MVPARLELRPVAGPEMAAFVRAEEVAFGHVPDDDEVAHGASLTRPEHSLAVFDHGRMVATAAWAGHELTLPAGPGADHPVAVVPGITAVGVHPTHRRRGLLTAMMERQLADLREEGHALAILMAAEAVIYGRFGYGLASSFRSVTVATRRSAFRRPPAAPGRIQLANPGDGAKVIPAVHDQARRLRPGELSRTPEHWDWHFRDLEKLRRHGSARFYAVHETGTGEADGYVSYRFHETPAGVLDAFRVEVDDLLALTPEVHAALWRFVLDVDLVGEVTARARPVDDPLRWLLADPRQARTAAVGDQLWVRIIDVPRALAARGYRAEARLVLDVRDPGPAGRWVLETGAGAGTCRPARASDPTDLALGLADLGAVYLGGVAPSLLARAGRVAEERAGALDRADAVFGGPVAPFSSTDF